MGNHFLQVWVVSLSLLFSRFLFEISSWSTGISSAGILLALGMVNNDFVIHLSLFLNPLPLFLHFESHGHIFLFLAMLDLLFENHNLFYIVDELVDHLLRISIKGEKPVCQLDFYHFFKAFGAFVIRVWWLNWNLLERWQLLFALSGGRAWSISITSIVHRHDIFSNSYDGSKRSFVRRIINLGLLLSIHQLSSHCVDSKVPSDILGFIPLKGLIHFSKNILLFFWGLQSLFLSLEKVSSDTLTHNFRELLLKVLNNILWLGWFLLFRLLTGHFSLGLIYMFS